MLNHIIISGRLTADPEIRRTNDGTPVTSFCIACDRNSRHNGEKVTDFFNCVAWRYNAEFVSKFFCKGKLIIVEGSLQHRKYTDKNGDDKHVYEIVAERVHFADDKRPERNNDAGSYQNPRASNLTDYANSSTVNTGDMGGYGDIYDVYGR